MFELFKEENTNKFSWDSIGDIKDGRCNLGEDMPVYVYRLFQFTMRDELTRKFGKGVAIEVFRDAGYLAGVEFANRLLTLTLPFEEFISELQKVLEDSKIGILRIEKFDNETGYAVITVGEDLDCSGLPITGDTVCNYDEGFLAGVLKEYTKQNYIVREVDCWASGARVCRFEAKVQ